ncbi:MAG: GNAT family N-acetyltransferase [Acidimicrobiales bacterium]
MEEIEIGNLGEAPMAVSMLSRLNFEEWAESLPELTHSAWESFYQECAMNGDSSLPTTIVGTFHGEVVGSVSLEVIDDIEEFPHYTPWISSLVVAQDYRNKGIASQLMRYASRFAFEKGHSRIFLWTYEQETMYQRLGWSVIHRIPFKGRGAVIMALDLEG